MSACQPGLPEGLCPCLQSLQTWHSSWRRKPPWGVDSKGTAGLGSLLPQSGNSLPDSCWQKDRPCPWGDRQTDRDREGKREKRRGAGCPPGVLTGVAICRLGHGEHGRSYPLTHTPHTIWPLWPQGCHQVAMGQTQFRVWLPCRSFLWGGPRISNTYAQREMPRICPCHQFRVCVVPLHDLNSSMGNASHT